MRSVLRLPSLRHYNAFPFGVTVTHSLMTSLLRISRWRHCYAFPVGDTVTPSLMASLLCISGWHHNYTFPDGVSVTHFLLATLFHIPWWSNRGLRQITLTVLTILLGSRYIYIITTVHGYYYFNACWNNIVIVQRTVTNRGSVCFTH